MTISVDEKVAGVLIPVFALRSDDDLGIGDTKCFLQAIDFAAENELSILQTLPINETSGDNSPYNALSSMALEPCLLSMTIDMVPGLTEDALANAVSKDAAGAANEVDYQFVKALKLKILRTAFESFMADRQRSSSLHDQFEKFQQQHNHWLSPYVVFRTITDLHNGDSRWTLWPDELRSCDSARVWLTANDADGSLQESMRFYQFVQWVADRQWLSVRHQADRKGIRLMGDIPFGVSRYSADVWYRQDLFDLSWSGGAPPEPVFHGDDFTKNWGQNWGIPVYDWPRHKKERFAWWKQRVARLLEHFHDFRIDHVLGFFRLYAFPWIPERNHEFVDLTEEEAKKLTDGKLPQFLPRPDKPEASANKNRDEGRAILKAIAEVSPDCHIVAEDLGIIIPTYLRPVIHKLGMAGFAIPIFEREEETREYKSPSELHPLSLATYATHDHEPLAAFYARLVESWLGPDGHDGWLEVQRLMRFLELDEEEPPKEFTQQLHESFLTRLVETDCWACVFMITDVLGITQRFNQPGLSGKGCWTERLSLSLAQYGQDAHFATRIEALRKIIRSSNRRRTIPTVAPRNY